MTGLLCSIGCFIVAFVTKDKLMLAIAAIFYLGWQICVLGSTISNKKKSDDLPAQCGNIILKPIVTEKSMDQMSEKKYTFKVDKKANKVQIKNAVEKVFDVKVDKVYTMNMNGKMKRMGRFVGKRPDWKKAIVKLTADSKEIQFFEGI